MFAALVTSALLAGVSDALVAEKDYRNELKLQDPAVIGGKNIAIIKIIL